MLNKELSHFAEHNKSDSQISEWVINTYLGKKITIRVSPASIFFKTLFKFKDKNEAVDLNQGEKFGSQVQLNRFNSSSNVNLHTMASLQEDEAKGHEIADENQIRDASPIVIPHLRVDLFQSQELGLNEITVKTSQIEPVRSL